MRWTVHDLRYALRTLSRTPVFTLVAVGVMALGIGANTAIFTFVNAYILRPLPFPDSASLVMVRDIRLEQKRVMRSPSASDYLDFERHAGSLEALGAIRFSTFNVTGGDQPELVQGLEVSSGFFRTLGVAPHLGRAFRLEEDRPGAPPSVIVSYGFWQNRFAGRSALRDCVLELNGEKYHVVGVMPPSFRFPDARTQLWAALPLEPSRVEQSVTVIARLRPNATLPSAASELASVLSGSERMTGENVRVQLIPLIEWVNHLHDARAPILILLGAVAFVLLIACSNVANLLLERSIARSREIAIRTALGAGRARIISQSLAESLLIALAGGTLGLLLGISGVKLLMASAPAFMLPLDGMAPDRTVLLFTAAVSVFSGLLFGLAPALQLSKAPLNEALKEGGRSAAPSGRGWLRRGLLIAEVASAVVLLIGAGLLKKSFALLQATDFGFETDKVLVTELILPQAKYPDAGRRAQFIETALDRAAGVPGVSAAAAVSRLGHGSRRPVVIEGQPLPQAGAENWVGLRGASGNYFRIMGVPLRAGRYLDPRDTSSAPRVAVVNETLARRFWPDENALGKMLRFTAGDRPDWITVVGVVGEDRLQTRGRPDFPEVYLPYQQSPPQSVALVLHSAAGVEAVAQALRSEIRSLDKDQPVANLETILQRLLADIAPQRVTTQMLAVFAAVALLLAVTGLYGVISYSVAQRTQEIGVRIALGAGRGDVLRLVVSQGMLLAGIGIVIGLGLAFAVTRLMAAILYGVTATDPMIFTAVPAVLGVIAVLACYIPARRAAGLDPVAALRNE